MIDNLTLDTILLEYKSFLGSEKWKAQESYKWKAVKTFQNNWDIDADDLPDMLSRALGDTINLLDTVNNFPRAMLIRFAEKDPDAVRKMFHELFNDDLPLYGRMTAFKASSEELLNKYFDKGLNHYQGEHAISVYLWLRYPDKYYIYQFSLVKEAAKRLKTGLVFKKGRYEDNIKLFMSFYDELCDIVQKDHELRLLLDTAISDDSCFYHDPMMKTLTIDLEYYIAKYYNVPVSSTSAVEQTDSVAEDEPTKYWMYAPGENASKWELCQQQSLMCIAWDEMGQIDQYATMKDVEVKMQEVYNKPDGNFMNDRLAVWEFCNVVKPGDIIFVKQGKSKIIGRGIVTGDYYYDDTRSSYRNCRNVKWTHIGEWDAPHDSVLKTLTDITKYPDYVKSLEKLFVEDDSTLISTAEGQRFYWLNANPKYWAVDSLKVGDTQTYTAYNDNGHQRKVFKYFKEVKPGDALICYETTPTKRIKAFCEITQGLHATNEGQVIEFRIMEKAKYQVPWNELIQHDVFRNSEPCRGSQGSLFQLTEAEYRFMVEQTQKDVPQILN